MDIDVIEKQKIKRLMEKHKDVFITDDLDLGYTKET
jgi:hypothetical protein